MNDLALIEVEIGVGKEESTTFAKWLRWVNRNSLAKCYLNVPYLWGGKTHFGIDCSGFTQQVLGICGYRLPRDAWQQEQLGHEVEFGEIQPTDIAYFKNNKGRIVHVGIILPNAEIIHASGKVRIDRLDKKRYI